LFNPDHLSRFDVALRSLDNTLRDSTFVRFPVTEKPYTYRSGKNLSTLDYAYVRGAAISGFQVAK
jgi:hypothetical protein